MFSPLEQFEVLPYFAVLATRIAFGGTVLPVFGPFSVVFTSLDFALLWVSGIVFLLSRIVRRSSLIFNFALPQFIGAALTALVNLVVSTASLAARRHIAVVLSLFITVLLFNVLALVPFGTCATAHIVFTQLLGVLVLGGLTLSGLFQLGWSWVFVFVPRNVPVVMLPFLIIIEFVSYLSRAISLSVRLFANMVAGHALLHILMGALVNVFALTWPGAAVILVAVLPTALLLAIVVLETGIAFLQAYVFVVLYLIYAGDALHAH